MSEVLTPSLVTIVQTLGIPTALAAIFAFAYLKVTARLMDENKEREIRAIEALKTLNETTVTSLNKNTDALNGIKEILVKVCTLVEGK